MSGSDTALLAVGYALAVPPLLVVRRLVRKRNAVAYFGGIGLGTALVASGWARAGKPLPAAVNAIGVLVLPAWWIYTGRRRAGSGD